MYNVSTTLLLFNIDLNVINILRGFKPVPDEEVMQLYGGTNHVPLHQVSGFYGKVSGGCLLMPA